MLSVPLPNGHGHLGGPNTAAASALVTSCRPVEKRTCGPPVASMAGKRMVPPLLPPVPVSTS